MFRSAQRRKVEHKSWKIQPFKFIEHGTQHSGNERWTLKHGFTCQTWNRLKHSNGAAPPQKKSFGSERGKKDNENQ